MMTEPPKSKDSDEICPICKRPKSEHTPEEIYDCTKKLADGKKPEDIDDLK